MLRPDPWVMAVVAAFSAILAVVVAFQALAAVREWRLRKLALGSLRQPDETRPESEMPAAVVRAVEDVEEGFTGVIGKRIPQVWDLHHLLVQSGVDWTLGGFAIRTGIVASIAGLVLLLALDSPAVAGVGIVVGGAAPYFFVRWKKEKRLRRLEGQLPGAIELIARAVRAGHPLSAGLQMAADEIPEPLASEFRATFAEQKFGLPFEEALLGLGDRVPIVDVRILITAILVQREVGGNLAEILDKIAETMRARFSLKRQVRVYTAQGRMSGYTLAALPIIVGGVITLINPAYMESLFNETLGHALLAGAAGLQGIGFVWIRKIVNIRY